MKRLTKALIEKWSQMTDDNYHYEVRYEIAKWAQVTNDIVDGTYLSYEKAFEELVSAVNKTYCGMPVSEIILTNMMMNDIRRVYGDKVCDKINDCL